MLRRGRQYTVNSRNLVLDLLVDLSRRVAHLEGQVRVLSETQRKLQSVQTLLQFGEHFKSLHLQLIKRGGIEDPTMRRALRRHGISVTDVLRLAEICQKRNEVAHPTSVPDLTDTDVEIVRLFVKIQGFLKATETKL
ncbi:hypothetical protein PSACC_01805 [Paramicrosporidium saccamoebae]|uniref:Uncharacterized protein n=1 Tax=Paramicrosporidium saccamoebae TaxID=1246581 RepID=A0A2H9TKZ6_9FUNG|nr:hypothetical protein PSACC_01805 [Paramicrosporidium saccamoebae]